METNDDTNSKGRGEVKEALLFAQRLADHEIANIERLHNHTIRQFAIIVTIAVAILGIFGWIGYSNIQRAAIAAAQSAMHDEVTKQVRDMLTKEDVTRIVKDQVQDVVATSLAAAIHKELTTPPLSTSIQQAADDETRRQISKKFAPRSFSPAQSKLFLEQLAGMKDLDGVLVSINALAIGAEAANYAKELKESVSQSKMKLVDFWGFPDVLPVDGVGIYYDKKQPESYARHLQDALGAAGVPSKLVPVNSPAPATKEGAPPALEIFIGARAIQ